MSRFSLPLTRLIHENLSVVMTFAFSRRPLEKMVEETFLGEWKYLNKALFSISEERVQKACLELALFMRMLDDEQNLSDYFDRTEMHDYGVLFFKNKPEQPLSLREVSNKIIHSTGLTWDIPEVLTGLLKLGEIRTGPRLICHGSDQEKWSKAEVEIIAYAASIGCLAS